MKNINADVAAQIRGSKLQTELASVYGESTQRRKARGRREFLVVISSVLALIYILPPEASSSSSKITIPGLSVEVPLMSVAAVFPTVLAALYVIMLGAEAECRNIVRRLQRIENEYNQLLRPNTFLSISVGRTYDLFLPIGLRTMLDEARLPGGKRSTIYGHANWSLRVLISLCFTLLPYFTVIVVTYRTHVATGSSILLFWNSVCCLSMLISLLGRYLRWNIPVRRPGRTDIGDDDRSGDRLAR